MFQKYSELENIINKFIAKHGVDASIILINELAQNFDIIDFKEYLKLISLSCRELDVKEKNLLNNQRSNTTNTRRVIAYYLVTVRNARISLVSKLLQQKWQTISQYIKDVEYRLNNPASHKDFVTNYNNIIKQLNIYIKIINK